MASELITSLESIVAHQGGVLSRQQALEAGLSYDAIRERLRTGRWQQIHPGGADERVWQAEPFTGA